MLDAHSFGLAVAAQQAFGEIEDRHTGYDHGEESLFRRIGAGYAESALGILIRKTILPVLLHRDPRYGRMG